MMTNSQRRQFEDRDERMLRALAVAGDFSKEGHLRSMCKDEDFPREYQSSEHVMDVGPYTVPTFPLADRIRWR